MVRHIIMKPTCLQRVLDEVECDRLATAGRLRQVRLMMLLIV